MNRPEEQVMKLKITITMDNAAFENCNGSEAARILRELCQNQLHATPLAVGDDKWLFDENGNRVGEMKVTL